ncbi:zinc finger domain-containing protein [Streptomyces alfalfae]|uniref:zinc finger domain-containing protein n=1 Tax=Streptomyces alfalfae TaxID=1642299 RepID=UPI002811C7E3|nr:hypothetical protein [Streptomyces alfalfae]
MIDSEAAELLTRAAAFDNRTIGEADATAWAAALADLPYDDDALQAVARYYSTPAAPGETGRRWIEPHHVRTHRTAIRNERLGTTIPAYKPPTEPETGRDFTARRRAQLTAIADGRETPLPIHALTGGPHPSVARAIAGIGELPGDEPYMPNGFREAIGLTTTPPELRVPCPKDGCKAPARQPCKTPHGRRRTTPHQARTDAAGAAA